MIDWPCRRKGAPRLCPTLKQGETCAVHQRRNTTEYRSSLPRNNDAGEEAKMNNFQLRERGEELRESEASLEEGWRGRQRRQVGCGNRVSGVSTHSITSIWWTSSLEMQRCAPLFCLPPKPPNTIPNSSLKGQVLMRQIKWKIKKRAVYKVHSEKCFHL